MKQTKKTKKTESGRSMIEMVGVLAVMGLITAGAFVLITSAMSSQKISRVDDDVSAIVAGTRLLYNGQPAGFAGLSDVALKTMGFDNVKNPWGGNYGINSSACSKGGTANECFTVTIGGFDSEDRCNALMNRTWAGGGKPGGFDGSTTCAKNGKLFDAKITYGKVQE